MSDTQNQDGLKRDEDDTVRIRTPRPSKAPADAGNTEPPKAPPVPKEQR